MRQGRTSSAGYVAAVVATGAVIFLRSAATRLAEEDVWLLPFILSVLVAAWIGGVGPGLLATALAAVAGAFLFIEPRHSFRIDSSIAALRLVVFVVAGAGLSWLSGALHRARREYAAGRDRAQREAAAQRDRELQFRQHLQFITDSAPVMIANCDTEHRYKFVNKPYAARFRLIPDDLVGKRIPDIVGDEEFEKVRPQLEKVLGGSRTEYEVESSLPKMPRQYLSCGCEPEYDSAGRVIGYVAAIIDITRRKLVEEQQRQTAEQLRLALRAARMVAWEADMVNQRVRAIGSVSHFYNGSAPDNCTIEDAWFYVHPDDREALRAHVEAMKDSGEGFTHQFRLILPDTGRPEPMWVQIYGSFDYDEQQRPLKTTGVMIDISEQKRAEEQRARSEHLLRLSHERLDHVVNSTELGLWYSDLPLNRMQCNEKCKEHFGLPHDAEVTIDLLFERIHPDDRETVHRAIDQSIVGKGTYDTQFRTVAPQGRVRWIRSIGMPFYDDTGKPIRFDGISVDITPQKTAEETLRASEDYFRTMADNVPAMIWVTDPSMSCVYVNKPWYEYTGQSPEQALGFGWLQSVHPDELEEARGILIRSNTNQVPFHQEYRLRRRDGTYRWVIATALPRFDQNSAFQGYVGCVIDVHERREFEQALKDADRRKDEFLATLAHELRNPLAPIRNSVNVLKVKGTADPNLQWAHDVIQRQVQQMARLLDDLLDVSRITRGTLELRKEPVNLSDVIQVAVETARPLIDTSGQSLRVSLPPEPVMLDADSTRLAQAFSNLLNNAAKYTDRGGRIELTADCGEEEVVVSVRDNGVGIPPEMLPRVFDLFTQVNPTLERVQGGLGIGLTLVRRLIEMHGGHIEAHSEGPGHGSEFVAHLPVLRGVAVAPLKPAAETTPAARHRILIADDNRDAAYSLGMLLKLMGSEVRIAYDGAEAVELAAEFKPELALLDIGMPRLNGYDAARMIRRQPGGEQIVLVALTGWGQDQDKIRSREAGFDHHLVKPTEPAALEQLLANLGQESAPVSG